MSETFRLRTYISRNGAGTLVGAKDDATPLEVFTARSAARDFAYVNDAVESKSPLKWTGSVYRLTIAHHYPNSNDRITITVYAVPNDEQKV